MRSSHASIDDLSESSANIVLTYDLVGSDVNSPISSDCCTREHAGWRGENVPTIQQNTENELVINIIYQQPDHVRSDVYARAKI